MSKVAPERCRRGSREAPLQAGAAEEQWLCKTLAVREAVIRRQRDVLQFGIRRSLPSPFVWFGSLHQLPGRQDAHVQCSS
jgi:hypothetical protein